MRRIALAALALATAAPVPALAFDDLTGSSGPAHVHSVLQSQLADAAADDVLPVFVHADSTENALDAVSASGLRLVNTWDRIDVAVAAGTPAQIRLAAEQDGVTFLEANQQLEYTLATSNIATRGEQARQTFVDASGRPIDGSGVSVAVLDSGVDGTHPFFRLPDCSSSVVRNLKDVCPTAINEFRDIFTGDHTTPDECFVDVTAANDSDTPSAGGHGTHVAGIVGGQDVDTTTPRQEHLHGAAPGARIVSLSIGAVISVYGSNNALNWVLNNHEAPCGEGVDPAVCPPIKVTNNSYGPGGGGDFYEDGYAEFATTKLQNALAAEGVVNVWAAGNDGGDGSGSTQNTNPAAQNPTPGILMVANYDDANTGSRDGDLANNSSRGVAGTPHTYPDLSAPGSGITSACRVYLPICSSGADFVDNGDYNTISGTSMAAPHVAGIVAQLFQADPTLTPAEVEDVLEDTAYKFRSGAAYESDPENGDDTTSFDKGHGLVDALAAVGEVLSSPVDGGEPSTANVTSCDGAAIITDASGDARGPVAGTQGTEAADLTGLDARVEGDQLVLDLSVANFSVVPAPGTTFTTYNVVWTAPDGSEWAATHSAPGGAFSVGPWDGSGLVDYLDATGSTTDGPNGGVTWNIPLATLGNPTIPVAPGASAAVNDPYAFVVAGEGVLGAGLVFTAPVDRAPSIGRGADYAVCGSPVTEEPTPTETATPDPTVTASPTETATPTPSPSCKSNGSGKPKKCTG